MVVENSAIRNIAVNVVFSVASPPSARGVARAAADACDPGRERESLRPCRRRGQQAEERPVHGLRLVV